MSRLILFSMYNDWYINENIPVYLKELKKNCDKLIVLSNHWYIDTKQLKRIQDIASIEFVENHGYDFWMYNAYFVTNPTVINEYDKILLCNDSVLIHKPLDNIFKRLDELDKEYMWYEDSWVGTEMIDKYEEKMQEKIKGYKLDYDDWWHIESWFIQLQGKAKELLVDLIRNGVWWNKTAVIMEYELRWSQIAKRKYSIGVINPLWNYNIKYTDKEGVSLCYQYPMKTIHNDSPFIKKDFRNYGYKWKFKWVIDYLCTEIAKTNL